MPPGTLVLDADWAKGMIRDAPRGAIPEGAVYNAVDFLLHQPGIAQKRGGTSYFGPALTGATYVHAVGYHQATATVAAVGENGHFYTVTSGAMTDLSTPGSAYLTGDTMKYRVGASKNLLVLTANDGTSVPKVYNGTTLADLGGTPPAGKYATIFKTRLALANVSANPDRVYFSDVPDIESAWDLDESWVDTDYPITGLAALQNTLIIFSAGKSQRITGTTPPPGTDFDRAPIGDVGCTDARSIAIYEGRVLFANELGIYATDGVSYQSLTRNGGIETLWRGLFSASLPPTRIACGLLGSFLIVTVRDTSEANVATLMCNLPRNAWWQVSNLNAVGFASLVGQQDECYYADKGGNRVVALAGLLAPASGNKNDANGTAVTPVLETRLLAGGPTLKHFGFGHVSVDMRDAASDNPTLAVSFAPGLEASSFTAVSESPLVESADNARKRFTIAKVSQGGTLRLAQTNASAKTELYAVELETRALPFQAGGQ